MSDIRHNLMETASSDDSHQLDPNLRSDLESLDDQIRSIIARLSARAAQSGGDETIFSYASSTVLLSIAATQTEKFSHHEGTIDIKAFLARANNAAVWVNNRRKRKSLVNTLSQG